MTIRERLAAIRRWFATRWYRLGLKLFPRPQDKLLDITPAIPVYVVVHRHRGLDEEISLGPIYAPAMRRWAEMRADTKAFRGELQLWKNGKCRDARGAV